jgi:hypothetical protein
MQIESTAAMQPLAKATGGRGFTIRDGALMGIIKGAYGR